MEGYGSERAAFLTMTMMMMMMMRRRRKPLCHLHPQG
jgi:hypothetical protein